MVILGLADWIIEEKKEQIKTGLKFTINELQDSRIGNLINALSIVYN